MFKGVEGQSKDNEFIKNIVTNFFNVSGCSIYIHKYIGEFSTDANGNVVVADPTTISDPLLLENRNRHYDPQIYEIRGIFQISDLNINLSQFGILYDNSDLTIQFSYSDCIAKIGRKILAGDVLELPTMRDYDLLDPMSPAINKYYVVNTSKFAASGYTANWLRKVWEISASPIQNAQEYADLLSQPITNPLGVDQGTLASAMQSTSNDMSINQQVYDSALANFTKRNFETQHYYFVHGSENSTEYPWIFAGDGIPPNGAQLLGSGTDFPLNPIEDEYFLRVDYSPHTLFQFKSGSWYEKESDYRGVQWTAAHRILETFINNTNTTNFPDGGTEPEKQNLYQAVKPRADF